MPFNGSGVFNRIHNWTSDAANNINILASRMDAEFNNYRDGLSLTLLRDGQATVTGTMNFGGNRIINLDDPVGLKDAINKSFADETYMAKETGGLDTQEPGLLANFNAALPTGFKRWNDTTNNSPVASSFGAALTFSRSSSAYAWIAARLQRTNLNQVPQFYVKSTDGAGNVGSWSELLHTRNFADTVGNIENIGRIRLIKGNGALNGIQFHNENWRIGVNDTTNLITVVSNGSAVARFDEGTDAFSGATVITRSIGDLRYQQSSTLKSTIEGYTNLAKLRLVKGTGVSNGVQFHTDGWRIGLNDTSNLITVISNDNTVARFEEGTSAPSATSVITRSIGDLRYAAISSQRFKEAIFNANERELSKIFDKLNPKTFWWGKELPKDDPRYGTSALGFIAEEVQEVFADGVRELNGVLALDPIALIAVLVARIRRLEKDLHRAPNS